MNLRVLLFMDLQNTAVESLCFSSIARCNQKSPNHIGISPSHDNMCSKMSSSKLDPFICASA